MSTTRRSVVKAVAWSAPLVAVAATAPAYATSNLPVCSVDVEKWPGQPNDPPEEKRKKSYQLSFNCTGGKIRSVTVDGKIGEPQDDGTWLARDFKDSRHSRFVIVTFESGATWSSAVGFPPDTTEPS